MRSLHVMQRKSLRPIFSRTEQGSRPGILRSKFISALVSVFLVGRFTAFQQMSSLGQVDRRVTDDNQELSEQQQQQQQQQDGWKVIHAFYGDKDIMPSMEKETVHEQWHGQAGQDKIVFELLKKKRGGFFLDLAANDPSFISNTYSLERDHDWNGICVEGNPMLWSPLTFRKCHLVGAVVSKNRMEKIEFTSNVKDPTDRYSGTGGIIGKEFDNQRVKRGGVSFPRYTVPLQEVFERLGAPKEIDYWSLDVEGAETFVLHSFPLDKYSFKVLTYERPNEEGKEILVSHGYTCLKNIGKHGETIWAKRTAFSELDLSVLDLTLETVSSLDYKGC